MSPFQSLFRWSTLVGMLLLAACQATVPADPAAPDREGAPEPAPVIATPETGSGSDLDAGAAAGGSALACPEPAPEGGPIVRDERAGFCIQLPAGFESVEQTNGSLTFLAPDTASGHRERGMVHAEPALGRSLDMAVEQILANHTLPGMEDQGPDEDDALVLDGRPAVAISGLPGQDLTRKLVTIVDDRLITFAFMPDDPSAGEANQEMERLYAQVLETLLFVNPYMAQTLPFVPTDAGYPDTADLVWRHTDLAAGDPGACEMLVIQGDVTWAGDCESASVKVQQPPYHWEKLRAHLQPFVMEGGDHSLYLAGEGSVYDPAWLRALEQWGRVSHAEVLSGKVSATGRTAMSWWPAPAELGEAWATKSDACPHLLVLSHGYAYAEARACPATAEAAEAAADDSEASEASDDAASASRIATGEAPTILGEGWLSSSEMARFMELLLYREAYAADANSLDGMGLEPLSSAEVEELEALAAQVFQELALGDG